MEAIGMRGKDIEFSIVSESGEEMLFGCLESLAKTMKNSSYRWSITVTCNAPASGLVGRLRSHYPEVSVVDTETAESGAAGHNRAMRISRARHIWLLNDSLLILPEAIRLVTEFLDRPENARVGVAGPRLLNPDGTVQLSTSRFPSIPAILSSHSGIRQLPFASHAKRTLSRFRSRSKPSRLRSSEKAIDVDTLSGACVAVRVKAMRQVGAMGNGATVGGQEAEWHRRFKEQGWKVVYCMDANVIHYGSQAPRTAVNGSHPGSLQSDLVFLKTGTGPATYRMFCASMVALFGIRAAIAWLARDHGGVNLSRHHVSVAWSRLLAK